jgi:hypothetical protein
MEINKCLFGKDKIIIEMWKFHNKPYLIAIDASP